MKSFIFVKMLNIYKQLVTLVCLLAISGHLSEVNLDNFVTTLTRRVISLKLTMIFSPVLGVEPVVAV